MKQPLGPRMSFVIAYVTVLIVFGITDALWLSQVAVKSYRAMLGDMMLDSIRIIPAAVFYFGYPVGVVVFAVLPALRDGSAVTALALGLLFGALCYATYDLTNFATIKVWTLQVTMLDIAYGAVASAICAVAGYHAVRFMS